MLSRWLGHLLDEFEKYCLTMRSLSEQMQKSTQEQIDLEAQGRNAPRQKDDHDSKDTPKAAARTSHS